MPAAIAALEARGRGRATRAPAEAKPRPKARPPPRDRVSLRQRAWPLVEMMKRSQAAGADIVWGV